MWFSDLTASATAHLSRTLTEMKLRKKIRILERRLKTVKRRTRIAKTITFNDVFTYLEANYPSGFVSLMKAQLAILEPYRDV